jgi:hypothetical protein
MPQPGGSNITSTTTGERTTRLRVVTQSRENRIDERVKSGWMENLASNHQSPTALTWPVGTYTVTATSLQYVKSLP